MGLLLGSLWLELALAAAAALLYFYRWGQKRYRYFEERGVPYLKPIFLLGSTYKSMIGKEHLAKAYHRAYQLPESGRMVGMFQVFQPVLVLRDPSLINQVMIKDFSSFHDHGFKIDTKVNPLEGHLFNLSGEQWRTLRKKLSPTFTSGKLKWMFEQMAVCGDSLVKVIDESSALGDVEVKDVLARFTTDVIGSCAFGLEPEAIKDPDCKFRVLGRKIFLPDLKQVILLGFRFAFPDTFLRLKLKTVPDDVADFFYSITKQAFEHRTRTGETRNDFVQLLLQLKTKGKIEYDPRDREEQEESVGPLGDVEQEALELTDDVLTAQVFVFFAAGFETSATTMSFGLYLLAKNQKEQERARREVKEIKAKHGGKITYEALKEMVYLEACISEGMRLMPALDILFRSCSKDYHVDGTRIDRGTTLVIPIKALHLDPNNFPEPESYRPERFLEEGAVKPGTYLPFGDGPRICIARRFALLEAKLGLAKILDSYVVTKSPRLEEPLVFNPRAFINMPVGGMWMNFEKIEA